MLRVDCREHFDFRVCQPHVHDKSPRRASFSELVHCQHSLAVEAPHEREVVMKKLGITLLSVVLDTRLYSTYLLRCLRPGSHVLKSAAILDESGTLSYKNRMLLSLQRVCASGIVRSTNRMF